MDVWFQLLDRVLLAVGQLFTNPFYYIGICLSCSIIGSKFRWSASFFTRACILY